MADKLIQLSGKKESGFFLSEFDKLLSLLNELKERKQKTILIGVTFGLLDFAEQFSIEFPELIVMETGGMKGRREELTREEVHHKLSAAFGVEHIHSEYGMTELLSQAYSKGEGKFQSPPWMKILLRDVYDPLLLQEGNKAGAVNIIDLANVYSCSFIATGDLGKVNSDESFEILGRVAQAEIRGCNLMVV
jgi:phenylacetate-coenzyme A ligase PaaK-like adenylate-forming protein